MVKCATIYWRYFELLGKEANFFFGGCYYTRLKKDAEAKQVDQGFAIGQPVPGVLGKYMDLTSALGSCLTRF